MRCRPAALIEAWQRDRVRTGTVPNGACEPTDGQKRAVQKGHAFSSDRRLSRCMRARSFAPLARVPGPVADAPFDTRDHRIFVEVPQAPRKALPPRKIVSEPRRRKALVEAGAGGVPRGRGRRCRWRCGFVGLARRAKRKRRMRQRRTSTACDVEPRQCRSSSCFASTSSAHRRWRRAGRQRC